MSFILNLSTLIKFCQLTYCEMDFYTSVPRGKMVSTQRPGGRFCCPLLAFFYRNIFLDSRCMGVSRILLHKKFLVITIFTPQIAVTK